MLALFRCSLVRWSLGTWRHNRVRLQLLQYLLLPPSLPLLRLLPSLLGTQFAPHQLLLQLLPHQLLLLVAAFVSDSVWINFLVLQADVSRCGNAAYLTALRPNLTKSNRFAQVPRETLKKSGRLKQYNTFFFKLFERASFLSPSW